ncbi:MAG: prohibitin family protein [Lachnospiraceae bacterium]|nr:prohibitin family protein [Lachnospiraceae bacterium]
MKNKVIGAVITAAVLIVGVAGMVLCIEKIPTGYEGVVYSMSGGVEDETLSQGWHLVSPFKQVKEFTIGNEQLLLTEDEGEAFKVATSDDASIAISFQMSYRFYSDNLVKTYSKFKGMDGEDIVNRRVKTVLKSKVSEVTSEFSMMDIYSGNRNEINNRVTEYLKKDFENKFGIEVVDASIIDVHPDDKLKQAIDNRVTALQEKQQAQAEQEKVKVEAETARIKAENEAKIKILAAEAEAKANKLKSQSISKELIEMTEAEARLKHGWVTVQGANSVVTTNK